MAKGFKTGGRQKGTPNKPTPLREAARQHTDTALASLAEIASDTAHSSCVAACRELLDRGYGKPAQALTGADGGAIELVTRIERAFVDTPHSNG